MSRCRDRCPSFDGRATTAPGVRARWTLREDIDAADEAAGASVGAPHATFYEESAPAVFRTVRRAALAAAPRAAAALVINGDSDRDRSPAFANARRARQAYTRRARER